MDTSASGRSVQQALRAEHRGRDARKYLPQVTTLVCPPEKHISVETSELHAAIRNRLELADRAKFDELIKLMSGVANFDFAGLKERVRDNFLPFTSGAKHTVYLQRNSKSLPSTASLDVREREFLSDVYEVLRASHFHLLTQDEWDISMSEDFKLSLPLTVDWEYMDDKMLSTWWRGDPTREALRCNIPEEMADRVLIFVRGTGQQRLSGLLIDQKLDLLMEYTVFWLWDKISAKLPKRGQKPKSAEELAREAAAAAQVSAERAKAAAYASTSAQSMITRPITADRDPPAVSPSMLSESMRRSSSHMEGDTFVGSHHKYAKVVERHTLKRHCPTLVTLIKAFMKKLELQEPSFKDIIVIYRRAYPPRKAPTSHDTTAAKSKEERMQGILNHRNIYMKAFGETAMADVEIVLPEKKVGIKPFQLINLLITIITGVVAAGLTILRSDKVNWNIIWTALSLVLTRCFTVYTSAERQKSMMQQQMGADLYDKMQDSQDGVLVTIMEEMAAQQYKQILLAYMMLIIKAKPLLLEDLDNACEDFLVRDFDSKIDYQVDDALPRLLRWGLIHSTPQGKLEAIPMESAIATLQAAWATAYTTIGSNQSTATCDLISGKGSAFGAGLDAYHQAVRASSQGLDSSTAESSHGEEHKHRNIFAKAKAKIGGHHSEKHRNSTDTGFGGAGGAAAQNAVALAGVNGNVAHPATPPPRRATTGDTAQQQQMREQAGTSGHSPTAASEGGVGGEHAPKKKRSFLEKMGLKEH